MIDQINELKQERERNAALYEKSAKEKQLLAMKFSKANEQLSYMMKKFGKRVDSSKENRNPNQNVNNSSNIEKRIDSSKENRNTNEGDDASEPKAGGSNAN